MRTELKDLQRQKEVEGTLVVVQNISEKAHALAHGTIYPGGCMVLPEKEAATLIEDFPDVFKAHEDTPKIIRAKNAETKGNRVLYVHKTFYLDSEDADDAEVPAS